MSEAPHILVVDDDRDIRTLLSDYLQKNGYRVTAVAEGKAMRRALEQTHVDLIVLDLMLPGMDGLEVCRRLRAAAPTPIVMLTAKSHEADRIVGLELGADDYVVKPFSPRELVARVRSVLRRTRGGADAAQPTRLWVGDLMIDPATREVEVGGRAVSLTAREFELLLFLVRHPRQVFTRGQLLQRVWEYTWLGDTSTVTVHIRRLREKVEDNPSEPRRVQTVYGVGYRFVPAGSQPS
jgi:DNA-binding response OmpR family regulator